MQEAVQVFVIGLGGVFVGMAALYAAIRLTSWAVGSFSKGGDHDQ